MNKNELTNDILKECFNISVGKAAGMLSDIIDKRILLDVPSFEFFNNINGEPFKIDEYLPKVLDGTLMVSSISFEKKLTGKANLIFPVNKMRTFINLCLNTQESENNSLEFSDVDFDIIKEIGNIILNCIIGEVGNFLDVDLNYDIPQVKIFDRIDFSKDIHNKEFMHILLLYITFIIDDTEIEGAIIIDLTLNSMNELVEKIVKIEDKLYE